MEDIFDCDSFLSFYSKYEDAAVLKKEQICIVDEIDSTNTELYRRVNENGFKSVQGLHHCLVAAASQTAGKGRIGRSFYSPKNSGIYFSFLYAPDEGISDPSKYTVASVVGICHAVESLYNIDTHIKWVNDIYVNNKKVCGILTEGVFNPETSKVDAVIVGIGINITTDKDMPDELKLKAGGIFSDECVSTVNRSELLARCIYEIFNILDNNIDYMSFYRQHFMHSGHKITVTPLVGDEKSCYEAVAVGITDDAGLIVRLDDGSERILHTGEVSLHNGNIDR